jgi:hypothetical protein
LNKTGSNPLARWVLALLTLAVLALSPPALAHKNGIQVQGCGACHRSSAKSMVTLVADRDPIMPGDLVTFTATISYPGVKVGGIFVMAPDLGDLGAIQGQGLTLANGGLTHSAPKAASGDTVTFEFTWQAPDKPGATVLQAYVMAANGNNQDTGDVPGDGSIEFTWGCTGQHFFFDADSDGYGAMAAAPVLGCADQPPPMNYSARGDDCDDAHDWVHPDAPERCNGKDDNCNDEIDENTAPEMLYPDPDGDGYYGANPGDPVVGCLPLAGYADQPGDCAPTDGTKFPGATEVCNFFDDNCDGRVDEGVRPHCGMGVCEVESATCSLDDCHPAAARTERCNGLDDDCNGDVDEGDLCPAGSQCLGISCVAVEGASGGSGGSGAASGGTSAASGGSGASTGGGATGSGGGGTGAGSGGSAASGAQGATQGTGAGANAAPSPQSAEQGGCGVASRPSSPVATLGLGLLLLGAAQRRARRR